MFDARTRPKSPPWYSLCTITFAGSMPRAAAANPASSVGDLVDSQISQPSVVTEAVQRRARCSCDRGSGR